MMYLSYPDATNLPMPSTTIDVHSRFQQTGAFFSLKAIELGYHCTIFGVAEPDGFVSFDRRPTLRGVAQEPVLSDVGRLVPQADGSVAIAWPL